MLKSLCKTPKQKFLPDLCWQQEVSKFLDQYLQALQIRGEDHHFEAGTAE